MLKARDWNELPPNYTPQVKRCFSLFESIAYIRRWTNRNRCPSSRLRQRADKGKLCARRSSFARHLMDSTAALVNMGAPFLCWYLCFGSVLRERPKRKPKFCGVTSKKDRPWCSGCPPSFLRIREFSGSLFRETRGRGAFRDTWHPHSANSNKMTQPQEGYQLNLQSPRPCVLLGEGGAWEGTTPTLQLISRRFRPFVRSPRRHSTASSICRAADSGSSEMGQLCGAWPCGPRAWSLGPRASKTVWLVPAKNTWHQNAPKGAPKGRDTC